VSLPDRPSGWHNFCSRALHMLTKSSMFRATARPLLAGRRLPLSPLLTVVAIASVAWLAFAAHVDGQTATHGLTIPAGQFKVFWTNERLAEARAAYAASPASFARRSSPAEATALDRAFVHLMTRSSGLSDASDVNDADSVAAINWATSTAADFYSNGPGNEARWWGEHQILIFSWLKHLMTSAQRAQVIRMVNRALANDLDKAWGGAPDAANNYNWGFTRNGILWGIASYNESYVDANDGSCRNSAGGTFVEVPLCGRTQQQIAAAFLQNALSERWEAVTAPFYDNRNPSMRPLALPGNSEDPSSLHYEMGRGGTLPEGAHYGPYLLEYFLMPLIVTADYGRPMINDTNFFMEAVAALIHSTSPKPTYGSVRSPLTPAARYQVFTFGDEQDNDGFAPATKPEYGNFMTWVANAWVGTRLGGLARSWLTRVNPSVYAYYRVIDEARGTAGEPFASLPLDFYSAGPGFLYTRNTWSSGATDVQTAILIQLGVPRGSHTHCDAGTFQIIRNSRWISKESPGRSVTYANHNGTGTIPDFSIWPHNGITVDHSPLGDRDNSGTLVNCTDSAPPVVRRLESNPNYAYAAVDLAAYAQGADDQNLPNLTAMVREFIYLRSADTLLVFDRVATANSAVKTALIHFPTSPSVNGNVITGTNSPTGPQPNVTEELRAVSLSGQVAGQNLSVVVVDEAAAGSGAGGTWEPQYRAQLNTVTSGTAYLINVMQSRTVGEPVWNPTLTETTSSFTIGLNKPGSPAVTVTLQKGLTSNGGSVQVGTANHSLATTVTPMSVQLGGVFWGVDGQGSQSQPAAPTGLRILP
jgi:hypothetical protein